MDCKRFSYALISGIEQATGQHKEVLIPAVYSRLQTGGGGENSEVFSSTSVHVVVVTPSRSKPGLQV